MSTNFKKNQHGFTLIEVVVAVFVIAIGLGAVIKTIGTVTRNTSLLTERTVAMWVAQNALAEFELDIENNANEETEGTEEMIGIEWHWTKVIENTQDPNIRRVEFLVRQDSDDNSQVYATLVTLLPIYPDDQANTVSASNSRSNQSTNISQANSQNTSQNNSQINTSSSNNINRQASTQSNNQIVTANEVELEISNTGDGDFL